MSIIEPSTVSITDVDPLQLSVFALESLFDCNNNLSEVTYSMPIIKSAIKRMRQTIVRRERNVGIKKDIKTANKAFVAKPSATTLSKAHSELDKAVKKGLIKKSTAARRKSALSASAKTSGVKLSTATKKTAAKPAAKPAAKKPAAAKAAPVKKAPAKKPAAKKTTK